MSWLEKIIPYGDSSTSTRRWDASVCLIILVCLVSACTPDESAGKPAKEGLLIQVSEDDPTTWRMALSIASGVLENYGDTIDLEIVAFGPGLKMVLQDSTSAWKIEEVAEKGVKFKACATTMKAMNVQASDLHFDVETVPGATTEIMNKQRLGWFYVRP